MHEKSLNLDIRTVLHHVSETRQTQDVCRRDGLAARKGAAADGGSAATASRGGEERQKTGSVREGENIHAHLVVKLCLLSIAIKNVMLFTVCIDKCFTGERGENCSREGARYSQRDR